MFTRKNGSHLWFIAILSRLKPGDNGMFVFPFIMKSSVCVNFFIYMCQNKRSFVIIRVSMSTLKYNSYLQTTMTNNWSSQLLCPIIIHKLTFVFAKNLPFLSCQLLPIFIISILLNLDSLTILFAWHLLTILIQSDHRMCLIND